jgi:myo-inositol-1(or 4)-monophosphatase
VKEHFTSQSFTHAELDLALNKAVDAVREIGPTLKENFGVTEFSTKGDERDWVTKWDKWGEHTIKARLANFSKDVGFCGEEDGTEGSSEVYWTIDPIDGTSHYVRGNDFCTTMISLVDHGSPVVAAIHDFVRGDTYTAVSGQGAYKNTEQRLKVSSRTLSQSYLELYTDEETPAGQNLRSVIEKSGAYLLRNAATGFTLLSVARGSTEGFAAVNNPYGTEWDIAPGGLLIHEAGGIVRNIGSDEFSCKNFDFVAANPNVFPALTGIIGHEAIYNT